MQKVLRKRVFRDLKENFLRYLALGLLIVLCMYLIVSIIGAADTVIGGVDSYAEKNKLEDGEFMVFVPLSEGEMENLTRKGITLEKQFYLDYLISDSSTLRVFCNRKNTNLLELDEGEIAIESNEVVLEKRYASKHELSLGEEITIGDVRLKIVGLGSVPDYDAPYKSLSDSSADSKQFGMAFLSDLGYDNLKENVASVNSEEYVYAYLLNDKMTGEELKSAVKSLSISISDKKISNLTKFLKAEDNIRVKASADDQVINKIAGLIAGVIVLFLFTYVISVFVIHSIEKESSVIGALYALGAKKRDLMIHYLMLPVLVTLFGGIIGTVIGFSKYGVMIQMQNCYSYFSTPMLSTICPAYLIVYGMVMPPLAAILVNCFVIKNKLSKTALSLIRNEQKPSSVSRLQLGKMGFIGRFRIRQMMKEARTGFTVLFGMLISLIIFMMGLDCYILCDHIRVENKADTKYEYMYTYKYPEEEVPEGGEEAFAKSLKKEIYGYNLDVTVLGIENQNPYFDAKLEKGKSKVVVSSAMAQKYYLKIGDKLLLTEEDENIDYSFTVEDIIQYSVGFYVFMDIHSMRELFGETENYYNVVFSKKELNIPTEKLYAVTSKTDIEKSSEIFVSLMMPMIYMLSVVSIIIFSIVMYLMLKVMVDRSAFHISLIKIFGYRTSEIRKLYLNGNFYIIAVGAALCIPLAKKIMDAIFPILVSNIACAINLDCSWQIYLMIYLSILVLYVIINQILVGRIQKMVPADVLKNRE